jgi:hypothetical protein|tara:strand:+ start:181 stop:759 length:579 start_codon:yes stop_codon:yes gene_type:complete
MVLSLLTRAGDLLYTFRFLKLLVTPFENTEAFKLGIIDEKGNRRKEKKIETSEDKAAWTRFHRLVYNIKKLIPGGKIGSYASALYLIKEKLELSHNSIVKIVEESGMNTDVFITEQSAWFVLEDGQLSPGLYKSKNDKLVNSTCDSLVNAKDQVRITDDTYPVGNVFGLDIYEAIHVRTQQKIYVTAEELTK